MSGNTGTYTYEEIAKQKNKEAMDLRIEVSRLERENKELKASIESLKFNKISADKRIDLLATENEQLEAQLEALKQAHIKEIKVQTDTRNHYILVNEENMRTCAALRERNNELLKQLEALKQPKKLAFEWVDAENKSILKINDNAKIRVVESSGSGIFVSLDIHILNQCGISPNILFRHCFDVTEAKEAAQEWLQGLFDGCFAKEEVK